jgi:DNA gyrase subunit B
VLTENAMRKRMTNWGLRGTDLVVRDVRIADNKADITAERTIAGEELSALIKALGDIERTVGVINRRGIHFQNFVKSHYNGEALPEYLIRSHGGEEEVFWDIETYEARLKELGIRVNTAEDEVTNNTDDSHVGQELHEVKRINEINRTLRDRFQLDLNDFLLKAERSVSGEALPTKFQLVNGGDQYDMASLSDICPGVRQIGGKGVEIKRFKGLGEMNADQLWDTTMNPETRTLLSVKNDDASEADRLFSILMGDDVEKRRTFIQDHALEVTNLDV